MNIPNAIAQQSNQNSRRAEDERRVAFARELSVNAVINLEIDRKRGVLLALQTITVSSAGVKPVLRDAEEVLHRVVIALRIRLALRGHTRAVNDLVYSGDRKPLVTGGSKRSMAAGLLLSTLCSASFVGV